MKCYQIRAEHDHFVLGFPANLRGELLSTANSETAGPWLSNLITKDDSLESLINLDCIKCVSGLFVSRRTLESIHGMRLSEGIAFVEIQIVDEGQGQIHEVFFFLSPIQQPRVVNLQESSFVPFRDGRVWYFTRPVVNYEAVAGFDLMSTLDLGEVCSEEFRQRVKECQLNGFKFSGCDIYR